MAALAAVVAMRGERRVPPRLVGDALDRAFFEAPLRSRLFPSFLGVLRMLKAMDWRRSACRGGRGCQTGLHLGPATKAPPGAPSSPPLTCLTAGAAAFFWASVVLCLRPSCRSRGVTGRGKQLVAFLDYGGERHIQSQTWVSELSGPCKSTPPRPPRPPLPNSPRIKPSESEGSPLIYFSNLGSWARPGQAARQNKRGARGVYLRGPGALLGLRGDPFALLPGGDARGLSYLGRLHAGSAQGLPGVPGLHLLVCDGSQAQGRLRGAGGGGQGDRPTPQLLTGLARRAAQAFLGPKASLASVFLFAVQDGRRRRPGRTSSPTLKPARGDFTLTPSLPASAWTQKVTLRSTPEPRGPSSPWTPGGSRSSSGGGTPGCAAAAPQCGSSRPAARAHPGKCPHRSCSFLWRAGRREQGVLEGQEE